MKAPQASIKCGLQPPDHPHIGSCKSNSIDSAQVPGTNTALARIFGERGQKCGN